MLITAWCSCYGLRALWGRYLTAHPAKLWGQYWSQRECCCHVTTLSISFPALENTLVCTAVWRGTALKNTERKNHGDSQIRGLLSFCGPFLHKMASCHPLPSLSPVTGSWIDWKTTQTRKLIAFQLHALKVSQIKLVLRVGVFFFQMILYNCLSGVVSRWINTFLWCNEYVPNNQE